MEIDLDSLHELDNHFCTYSTVQENALKVAVGVISGKFEKQNSDMHDHIRNDVKISVKGTCIEQKEENQRKVDACNDLIKSNINFTINFPKKCCTLIIPREIKKNESCPIDKPNSNKVRKIESDEIDLKSLQEIDSHFSINDKDEHLLQKKNKTALTVDITNENSDILNDSVTEIQHQQKFSVVPLQKKKNNNDFQGNFESNDPIKQCSQNEKIKLSLKSKEKPLKNLFKCEHCSMFFSSKRTLRNHVEHIHLNKKFKCKYCMKSFSFENSLKRHIKYLHCSSQDQSKLSSKSDTHSHRCEFYICKYCGKKLLSQTALKLHEDKHRGITYKCSQCSQSFTELASFYRHRKSAHLGFVYICDICTKKFADDRNLKKHKNSIHGLSGKDGHTRIIYECNVCKKKCNRKDRLKEHLLSVHYISEENSLFCPKCNHHYATKSSLRRHQKDVHQKLIATKASSLTRSADSVNKWKCKLCGIAYAWKSNLNKHMKKHFKLQNEMV